MKTIGFVTSHKENENRRALLPDDVLAIRNKQNVYIEHSYGDVLGYSDADYLNRGIGGICSREEILRKDIICDPKVGDAEYLDDLSNQVIFGWVHAVQNKDITDKLVSNGITAFCWEDMFEMGRHVFWRNNEIAGEAAIMHAYLLHGISPCKTNVAILGRGNIARGAQKALNSLGANVITYDRRTEELLRREIGNYDVIVNAILWDTSRNDHIIYKDDLKRMKRGSMIIDISCDRNGGVETSIPTTIDKPSYFVDGIRHYVVDHTPSLFYKSTSHEISREIVKYIDYLIEESPDCCQTLTDAMAIEGGVIRDKRILSFQNRD